MVNAARKASVRLKRDYGEVDQLQVSRKGPSDFVSVADTRTERILHEELKRARPNFGFLMEEAGAEAGEDPDRRWIIDPIDGTTNFLHGIAHFAISIALEEHGEITAGIVFEPIQEQMFTAEKGAGAYLNDHRIRVSSRSTLGDAIFATSIPFQGRGDHPRFLKQLEAVMAVSAGVRRFGTASLDLAYVAAGRFDGFWEETLQPWDIAAGIILVREAGGFVTDLKGGAKILESGNIVAANTGLHESLAELVTGANG